MKPRRSVLFMPGSNARALESGSPRDRLSDPGCRPNHRDGSPLQRKKTHAVSILAASPRPSSAMEISLMRNFWTFPVTVIGNESTIFQRVGIL